MKVTLNLATRPFTNLGPALKRLRIGMGILAALSLLSLIGLHLKDDQAAEARALEHSLDGQIASIEAQRQAAQAFMQKPENAELLKETEFLNERFDEKAFSWTLAMEAMETVLPAGVEVTAIEPQRTKEGNIDVEIRVLGPHDQSVNLMRNLERSRRFIAPRIESETAQSSNSPNSRQLLPISASNPFEFELFADYNPPTPEERASLKKPSAEDREAHPAVPKSRSPEARQPLRPAAPMPRSPEAPKPRAHASNGGQR